MSQPNAYYLMTRKYMFNTIDTIICTQNVSTLDKLRQEQTKGFYGA